MTLLEKSWTLALFVASVISSAWWPTMPDWRWLLLGIITTGSIIKLRRGLISIGVIVGFMVVIVHGNIMGYQRQALFQAGENSTIIGRVDSSFTQISHGYEGVVAIKQVNTHTLLPFLKPKVRLITPFPLAVNSEFTTNVLIKPIIGFRNEAGFDAEKQSMGSGVVARAVVTKDSHWVIRTSSSWRESIIQTVERDISRLEHFALIKALAFTDRTGLTKEDWQFLRDSGLLHLVSISGLHIGMALTFGLALGGLIRLAMPRYWFLPSVSGLAFAIVYAWLADFSLPTTRAVSVCIIYIALKYWLVHWSPWRVLLLAVALQLFFQPFASFSLSFWLSYLSVGAVLFAVNTVQDSKEGRLGKLRILLLTQLILSLLIVPISGYFFSGFSWSSLVYNLVFIPWFGFVVVPIMFAALIASLLFPMLATVLWYLLDIFLVPLSWSVRYAIGTWQPISAEWTFVIAVVSAVLVLRHVMPRYVWMFVCVIVVMTGLFPKQDNQTWRIDVLDVGHGLAVLVEKEGRVLLYDTGKAWQNGSIAEQVITPVLHRRGYSSVDTMILSHADNDHAGGRKVIEQYFSPKHKLSSQSFLHYQPCIAAEKWKWQGLNMEVLWPPKPVVRAYNPHSCVISLEDPSTGFKMLFTGDIEAISEWILLREPEKLRSDVMLVPHHGSKSSSNPKFINVVEPSLAIASTAKLNQWGMPATEVVQTYTDSGVSWLDTGSDGQITILLDGNNWRFESKRRETIEPWYRQMLRNRVE
ncbi:TPA: DNA internalization-related competence protein ComEC/Rec2 [Vibrio parahaemolyticus]|nr:DNA internalization-related competence protein ComEC/Rec2 [Vibrio parahaemolyticus]